MSVEILAVQGIPEVQAGDDLAGIIQRYGPPLVDGDVLVVTSKVVSKAEGRVVDSDRDAAIDAETVRIVARRGDTRIVQTRQGFVMAAAGVDASNVAKGSVVLLPVDADASARQVRERLRERLGVNVGVVVSDTFGRPWRVGVTDVAVGVAGLRALEDLRGEIDPYGNELQLTVTCTVDEIAAAADLVKGKLEGVPIAIVRGLAVVLGAESADTQGILPVIRSAADDMFAFGTRDVLPARVDVRRFTADAPPISSVQRALAAADLAARPAGWDLLRFTVVESPDVTASLAELVGDEVVATAPVVVVPYLLVELPTTRDLLAAGAAVENVLVALAIEQLGACWVMLADSVAPAELAGILGLGTQAYPLGAIAVGLPSQ
jgi:coenzyme F420-0:L-glutamate ligase/coenzyme F420-1:gamma-L-glutamate ligase